MIHKTYNIVSKNHNIKYIKFSMSTMSFYEVQIKVYFIVSDISDHFFKARISCIFHRNNIQIK